MAQESDLSKTADKGKGKAVDDEKKPQDVDGKTPAGGKKEEEQNGGFLGFTPIGFRYQRRAFADNALC